MSGRVTATQIIAGRYRVAARIGSGGMGEVFRARDQVLGRTVAIKVLPEELAARPGFVERFRAEAQAAARLSHPNAVQVHDWGSDDGSYYMVMEYVRGRTLREVLAARGRVEPAQAAAIIGQLLAALEAAHGSGLVHRDIKPENVLVTVGGDVKVADFGIARIAEGAATSGDMLGTISYAAPEQIRGEAVDGRADLYAAAFVLYELLTGSPPFEGDVAHVLNEHLTGRVPAPSLECPEAAPLDRVVARATALDPAGRYPSAAAMRADLEDAALTLPEAPPLPELASELTSEVATENQETMMAAPRRKRRKLPAVVAALLVLIVAAAAIMVRPVPKVAGTLQDVALSRLHKAGLKASLAPEFSDNIPTGRVIAARAPFGPFGVRGATVALRVSKGLDIRQIPPVETKDLAVAEKMITDAGLFVGGKTPVFSTAVSGTVTRQEPRPQAVKPGTPVSLWFSKGPEMVAVPGVTGTAFAQAQSALSTAGLKPTRQDVASDTVPAETVVDQTPKAGTSVPKDSAVTLVVSTGPAPFAMPNVVTVACSTAKTQLEAAGLVVTVTSRSGPCTSNTVLRQDPLDGKSVRKGDAATLFVP